MVKTSICLANSIIDINLSPVQKKDSKIGCLLLKTRFDFLKITYARLLNCVHANVSIRLVLRLHTITLQYSQARDGYITLSLKSIGREAIDNNKAQCQMRTYL